jgi:hypothetical protein
MHVKEHRKNVSCEPTVSCKNEAGVSMKALRCSPNHASTTSTDVNHYPFCTISSEPLGCFRPSAMQFLCKATHAAFPQPGTITPPALPPCTASCPWCGAATCPTCLQLLRDPTPPHGVWLDLCPPPGLCRGCTETLRPAAAVAGLVSHELAPCLLCFLFSILPPAYPVR